MGQMAKAKRPSRMEKIRLFAREQGDLLQPTQNALALIAELKALQSALGSYHATLAQLRDEAMKQDKRVLAAWLEGLRGGALKFQQEKPVAPKRQIDRDNLVMLGGDAEATNTAK